MSARRKVAVIGSGNIGTDLMIKVIRLSKSLEMGAMAGIDPDSDGLARARPMGVPTTAEGVAGLLATDVFGELAVVFDATSASAHQKNYAALTGTHVRSSTRPLTSTNSSGAGSSPSARARSRPTATRTASSGRARSCS
jgi:acetaldehyde dehydrogenase (acetylating)